MALRWDVPQIYKPRPKLMFVTEGEAEIPEVGDNCAESDRPYDPSGFPHPTYHGAWASWVGSCEGTSLKGQSEETRRN